MQVDGDYLRHFITRVKGKIDHWNRSNKFHSVLGGEILELEKFLFKLFVHVGGWSSKA